MSFRDAMGSIAGGTGRLVDGGADGADGQAFDFRGVGVPSGGLGVDDDTYLDLANGDTYLKDSGVWGLVGSIAGTSVGYPSRDLMKATAPNPGAILKLTEGKRFGEFKYELGDFSARIAADTEEGVFIKLNSVNANIGALVRRYEHIKPEYFGAVADGQFSWIGVALLGDNTFTSAAADWNANDVGKMIKVGGAGASGLTLITTIASINSASSIELTDAPATSVPAANYTYGTDDQIAIVAARDFCWRERNLSLNFADGRWCYSGDMEFAREDFSVNMLGGNVWFESFRISSGNGLSLNGTLRNTGGVHNFSFGEAHRANFRGNSNCANGVYYNGLINSTVRVLARDAQIGILGDNTGNAAAIAAVNCVLELSCLPDNRMVFDVNPVVGVYVAFTYACRGTLNAEFCGSSAPTPGCRITASNGNVWTGGSVQSNLYGGAVVTSTASRNTFINMHNEFNGQGEDWAIGGSFTRLINCAGVGTQATYNPANTITGDYVNIDGGEFHDLIIESGADGTHIVGTNLATGTFSDLGDGTTITDCYGTVDKSPPPTTAALSLLGGAADTGAPYDTTKYYRSRSGTAHISGVLTAGTISGATVQANVSAGYRPAATITMTGTNLTTDAPCAFLLSADGNLTTRYGISTGDVVDLGNVEYPIAN